MGGQLPTLPPGSDAPARNVVMPGGVDLKSALCIRRIGSFTNYVVKYQEVCTLGCSLFPSIQMAISIQFSLYIRNLNPKFPINLTKNNFAKGPKQKPVAECCRSAKFGGAQAKQGRALATLFLGQII